MKGLVLAVAASLAIAACSGQAAAPAQQTDRPRPTVNPSSLYQGSPSLPPEVIPSDEPSTAPVDNGPLQESVGDVVSITCANVDCLTVSLDKVAFAKSYRDPQGYLDDTPDTKGDVFLAYHVTYRATGPSADYNEFDWGVFVNDTADDITTFVEHGPKPTLSSGNLPQGKSASGWIFEEVPAKGQVVVAYEPGQNDIFEVVVRSK